MKTSSNHYLETIPRRYRKALERGARFSLNFLTLSPYKIWWAEFTPVKGRPTKQAYRAITGDASCCTFFNDHGHIYYHYGDRAAALSAINSLRGKLGKAYTVKLFTDKQQGLRREADGYRVPFTTKQNEQIFTI